MFRSSPRSYEAGSSFKPAFLFLKPEQRRALSALYGYARAVDDIADDAAAAPAEKEAALAAWKTRIDALFAGAAPQDQLEEELARAAGTFFMSKENLLLLLEGMGMDARKKEYASFEELKRYMYRAASAVGLAALEIFGWRGGNAAVYAEQLGYAVQLTNIIRDVFEDAALGRVYLPLEDLKKFGVSSFENSNTCVGAISKAYGPQMAIYPDNFIELMRFEAARARECYSRAAALGGGPEKKNLLSAFIMAQVYSDLLDKIEARGFKTAGPRIRLNGYEKCRAVYRAWRKTRRDN